MHAQGGPALPDHDATDGPDLSSPALLHGLTQVSQDGLYAVAADGRVLAWSWGAETLYGYTAAEALGQDAADLLVPEPARAEWTALLHEAKVTGSAIQQATRRRKDRSELHVQALLKWIPSKATATAPGFLAVGDRDLTEAQRLEQELSEQVWSLTGVQEFLRSVLDASTDYSIVALDLAGNVIEWNPGAAADFGRSAADAKGKALASMVQAPVPADAEALRSTLARGLADGRCEAELALARRDGTMFPARMTVTARRDAFGTPVGSVVIVKDISAERQAEVERRTALERLLEIRRLKEVGDIKTQLLNTASHELGTPLTPIRIQLQVLQKARDRLDPALHKPVDALERNFRRLAAVIQAMIEVVRLQGGGLQLRPEPVQLRGLVDEVSRPIQAAAAQANVVLSTDVDAALTVKADPHRLGQAIGALVANAVKFTPAGGQATVSARAEGGQVAIAVTDTGIGMTNEQLGRLFEPFSQVHDTSQRTDAGVGIGLYTCKAIIEAHGGKVTAMSPGPGKGSAFTISLPA